MDKLLLTIVCGLLFCQLHAQDVPVPTPQWRPLYHFTPEKNWTNDPNGLIYINGIYHLYNQQNPFENKWGHMSWGHATSKDLIHWTHLPIAIPETIDKDTTWRFSGCAVYDKNNSSGFCKDGGCIVAIYTVHQPNLKKESQFIAYSNDGGLTYTNYDQNPVIDLNKKDFRDPNVFWNEQLQYWTMVVALPYEHKVQFYKSVNLKNWDLLSEFGGNQGITKNVWECPFLIQLPVDGNLNHRKWALLVSCGGYNGGAFIQYFVGDFDGKTFTNDNPADVILTVDYGDTFYAAIPWNNLPGDKKTYIGWLVPGSTETYPWKGQMSIARDLSLRTTNSGTRLVQNPSSTIGKTLAAIPGSQVFEKKDWRINDKEISLNMENRFNQNSYWIDAEISPGTAEKTGFKIVRKKDENGGILNEIIIGFDLKNNTLYVDKSRAFNNPAHAGKQRLQTILKPLPGKLKLQILVDKSSLEIFAGEGENVISTMIYPLDKATGISVFAEKGNSTIDHIKLWDMSSIAKQ